MKTDTRKELLLTDLGNLFIPQENISPLREKYKWNSVPYETAVCSGTMLISVYDGAPQPVTLPLQAEGWYRIYVALGTYGAAAPVSDLLCLKLSGDETFMHLSPSDAGGYAYHSFQETFWRCADLTGQSLELSKHLNGQPSEACLAWVRLVPMTDEEVAAYQADQARTDTKRIYATNDMHGMLGCYALQGQNQWRSVVQEYLDSDVEWLSLENILVFDGDVSTGNADNFAFCRDGDKRVQELLKQEFTPEMLSGLVEYGHASGLKMCLSLRMGAWGMEFPYDQMYFVNAFAAAHPELRCIDRDGDPIDALSYIYPEVQEYMLDHFTMMAKTGCDAVEMIYNRGVPYVLFEPPFVELFRERYGEDPRYLPLDDDRVTDLRCEIMTGFVRRLRARLDEISPDRKIGLHARTQFSVWDARHVAEDLETWAREGLITAIISYPQRIREILKGDIWQAENPQLLDLEKYHKYALESPQTIIYRRQDFNFMPPMEDSRGVLRGPATQQERVDEFMRLEREYGVTVYLEIMPRHMTPAEYRDRALELYNCGCGHISLWDTYSRVPCKPEWSMMRRLGHKEELAAYASGEGELFRDVRILRIAGKDVSRYKPAWGG